MDVRCGRVTDLASCHTTCFVGLVSKTCFRLQPVAGPREVCLVDAFAAGKARDAGNGGRGRLNNLNKVDYTLSTTSRRTLG